MPTLNQALAAIERHLGFPQSRSRTIARRLQEAGILPSGSPGVAPRLDSDGFVSLFLALAADTRLHMAAAAVAVYRDLTPGGVPLEGAPSSFASAGVLLRSIVDSALEHPDDFRHLNVEIVSNWPEVALHWSDGTVQRHIPVGALPGQWQSTTHRRSTTVAGAALRNTVRAIFKE